MYDTGDPCGAEDLFTLTPDSNDETPSRPDRAMPSHGNEMLSALVLMRRNQPPGTSNHHNRWKDLVFPFDEFGGNRCAVGKRLRRRT